MKKDTKDENKDQASPSVQAPNKNKTTKHPTKMEIKKSPSLLKVTRLGADQKMAPMPQTEEAVEVTMQPSPWCWWREASQAQPIRALRLMTLDNNPYEYPQASSHRHNCQFQ